MPDTRSNETRPPCTVLHVEDSEDDALLFARFIETLQSFRLVGQVTDADEALAWVLGQNQFADRRRFPFPDIVVLDLRMSAGSYGLEFLSRTQRLAPRPVVGVLTHVNDPTERRRAIDLGA